MAWGVYRGEWREAHCTLGEIGKMVDITVSPRDSIKQQIQHILESPEMHEVAFQEIFNCSASCGGAGFTKAVFRMPYFGIDECIDSDPPEPWMSTVCRRIDVFDFNLLSKLVKDPNFDENVKRKYGDLIKFIEDKNQHEACLQKMYQHRNKDGTLTALETDIAYTLAVHLFAPLSSNQRSCILDNHSKGFPKNCPGGCGRFAAKGNTGIGADQTWHGYADILVNQTIPVKVVSENSQDLAMHDDLQDHSDIEDSDDSVDVTYSLSVEIKFHQRIDPISEVLAQTITNGFAQVNENKSLKNFLIPSFACSIEDVVIFAYDPVNDLLACIPEYFGLWSKTDKQTFDMASIVRIWLYLNFATFMLPSISERLVIEKSNFHKIAPLLHYQQHVKCGMKGFSSRDKGPRVRETRSALKRRRPSDDLSS